MSESKPVSDKSVGVILRLAREEKGLTLEHVSKATKIHVNVLKAIESDDFKPLGGVYAKSFLRIYADYLGVDKEDAVRRYELATGGAPVSKKIIFPGEPKAVSTPTPGIDWVGIVFAWFKKVPWKWVVLVLVSYGVVAGGVKFIHSRKKPASVVSKASVSAKTKASKKEALVTPVKPQPVKSAAVVPSAAPVVARVPVSEKAAELKPAPPPQKPKEKIVLVMKARERTWIQVKVDGKIVFQNVLAKGSAESWQAAERIDLWIANAGAIQLELNGKMLEKIGRKGQMLKNVVVTRSGLTVRR